MLLQRCMSAGFAPSSSASLKRLAAIWTAIDKARSYTTIALANYTMLSFPSIFLWVIIDFWASSSREGDWNPQPCPATRLRQPEPRRHRRADEVRHILALLQKITIAPSLWLGFLSSHTHCNSVGTVSGMWVWLALPHRPYWEETSGEAAAPPVAAASATRASRSGCRRSLRTIISTRRHHPHCTRWATRRRTRAHRASLRSATTSSATQSPPAAATHWCSRHTLATSLASELPSPLRRQRRRRRWLLVLRLRTCRPTKLTATAASAAAGTAEIITWIPPLEQMWTVRYG